MKKVYSIRDNKMESFGTPVIIENDAIAIRQFGDLINKGGDSVLAMHPADFGIYAIAEFDAASGKFTNLDCPKLLSMGSDFAQETK